MFRRNDQFFTVISTKSRHWCAMQALIALLLLSLYSASSLRPSSIVIAANVKSNKHTIVTKLAAAKSADEVFVCTECGMEHIKWMGRCTSCNEWNCVKPMRLPKLSSKQSRPLDPRTIATGGMKSWLPNADQSGGMISMNSINISEATLRHTLQSGELNRVLGGGLVRGSTILLAGEPGIGKSTLLIQLANDIVTNKRGTVVYISGEENPQQIAARAARLQLSTDGIFVLCDCDTDRAVQTISAMSEADAAAAPALIIVDSVQTMTSSSSTSSAGSVGQIRDSTAQLVQLAKLTGSAVLIAGHVTKSGEVAGPRILEHMVDTVLYMEGNEQSEHRLLRGVKNRFGSTSEVGVFSMTGTGLVDVDNPSELFLTPADEDPATRNKGTEGSCVAVLMEGTRPLLSEIQCLVNGRPEPNPNSNSRAAPARRAADGFPLQRLQLICAVIEKRLQLPLWNKDVYLNVVGGLRVSEPSADLAVAMSIISSALEEPIKPQTAFVGEIGLGGELRAGKRLEERIREAKKMGYQRIIVPRTHAGMSARKSPSQSRTAGSKPVRADGAVVECRTLFDVLAAAFVNPDVSKSFTNRKSSKSRYRKPSPVQQSNAAEEHEHFEPDAEEHSDLSDEFD